MERLLVVLSEYGKITNSQSTFNLRGLEGTFKARKPRHELQMKVNSLETIQNQAGN